MARLFTFRCILYDTRHVEIVSLNLPLTTLANPSLTTHLHSLTTTVQVLLETDDRHAINAIQNAAEAIQTTLVSGANQGKRRRLSASPQDAILTQPDDHLGTPPPPHETAANFEHLVDDAGLSDGARMCLVRACVALESAVAWGEEYAQDEDVRGVEELAQATLNCAREGALASIVLGTATTDGRVMRGVAEHKAALEAVRGPDAAED